MSFAVLKALHLIFMVTWFAGLFYMVRLLVYVREAKDEEEPKKSILSEQYLLMLKRLWYGITWPSLILTLTFGIWMLVKDPWFIKQPWMHLKLSFIVGLVVYHHICGFLYKKAKNNKLTWSSFKLRMWNEVATIFLISIIFIVVVGREDMVSWIWAVVGIIGISLLLFLAIRVYKNLRNKKQS